jgi:phosphoglycerol transferase
VLTFTEPLPRRFTLVVTAATYGPNVGQPVTFIVGPVRRSVVFDTELGSGPPEVRRLSFEMERGADRIEIHPSHPTRPPHGDDRALGLALIRLQIETN